MTAVEIAWNVVVLAIAGLLVWQNRKQGATLKDAEEAVKEACGRIEDLSSSQIAICEEQDKLSKRLDALPKPRAPRAPKVQQ